MRIIPRQEPIEMKRTSPWWWRVPVILITLVAIVVLLTIAKVASAAFAGDLGMLLEADLKFAELWFEHIFRLFELVWRG